MSRVIKFRHWDKRNAEMKPAGTSEIAVVKETEWYLPLQFTGLLDVNGKEIYEGDVLRRARDGDGYKFYIVVEFSHGCFGGSTRPGYNHYLTAREWGYCDHDGGGYDEVIGNIYENPELLKV